MICCHCGEPIENDLVEYEALPVGTRTKQAGEPGVAHVSCLMALLVCEIHGTLSEIKKTVSLDSKHTAK